MRRPAYQLEAASRPRFRRKSGPACNGKTRRCRPVGKFRRNAEGPPVRSWRVRKSGSKFFQSRREPCLHCGFRSPRAIHRGVGRENQRPGVRRDCKFPVESIEIEMREGPGGEVPQFPQGFAHKLVPQQFPRRRSSELQWSQLLLQPARSTRDFKRGGPVGPNRD